MLTLDIELFELFVFLVILVLFVGDTDDTIGNMFAGGLLVFKPFGLFVKLLIRFKIDGNGGKGGKGGGTDELLFINWLKFDDFRSVSFKDSVLLFSRVLAVVGQLLRLLLNDRISLRFNLLSIIELFVLLTELIDWWLHKLLINGWVLFDINCELFDVVFEDDDDDEDVVLLVAIDDEDKVDDVLAVEGVKICLLTIK